MTEEWRPVVGYEGLYEISSNGVVKSLARRDVSGHRRVEKLLKSSAYKYASVALSKGGVPKTRFVHGIVLEAFSGPRPAGYDACHNNGNGLDNRASNLRWDTKSANSLDLTKHCIPRGFGRGEAHPMAKLRVADVRRIREASLFGASKADLINVYGAHRNTIRDILNRKYWNNI